MQATDIGSCGGVDSRSNPLAMPQNRSLRCRNFVPQRDGHLELRWGYSTVTMQSVVATEILSPTSYTLFDGTAYVVFTQADGIKRLKVADGSVITLPVKGHPISGYHRWSWAFANNRLYGVNTTDNKFMDANGILRDIGLHALFATDAAAVSVTVGSAETQGAILTSSLNTGGNSYAVGDTGTITDAFGAGTGATYKVLTVNSGAVATYSITAQGSGYSINVDATAKGGSQPGSGTGFTINVLTVSGSGLPASTVGGVQPGYQFYACIYNIVTGDVSNRMPIGSRVVPSVPSDINISRLPDLSRVDAELVVLIGRTVDGGDSPYAVIDSNANWIYVPNGSTGATITQPGIDQTSLLPYRNAQPQNFAQIARVGDRLFAVLPNSPRVFFSESQADYIAAGNFTFVGNAPACWPADNFETFPTGGTITCLQGDTQQAWVFTLSKMALLNDAAGVMTWQGEWDVGCAGFDAFTSSPFGPHWVTGKKQIATMGANGPVPISDEYERALLGRIGDAYIGQTQIAYQSDPSRNIDRLMIRAYDVNGNPFQVFHDFAIRDYANFMGTRSPNGQGYDYTYSGPLASPYTIGVITDVNGYKKVWAGANNGYLYQLDSGPADGPNDFTGDYIQLINAGPNRPGLDGIEWYGDKNVRWSIGKKLSMTPDKYTDLTPTLEEVGGSDVVGVGQDYQYRVSLADVELKHAFVRAQLDSHGNQLLDPGFTDGNLNWSNLGTVADDGGGLYLELICPIGYGRLEAVETNDDGSAHLFSVSPGVQMALSVDMEVEVAPPQSQSYLGLAVQDANGNLLTTYYIYATPGSGWVHSWQYVTMPPNAATCYVLLGVYQPGAVCRFRNPSAIFLNDPRFTQAWNDPPHCPLETYGRLYIVTPLTDPEIGHR